VARVGEYNRHHRVVGATSGGGADDVQSLENTRPVSRASPPPPPAASRPSVEPCHPGDARRSTCGSAARESSDVGRSHRRPRPRQYEGPFGGSDPARRPAPRRPPRRRLWTGRFDRWSLAPVVPSISVRTPHRGGWACQRPPTAPKVQRPNRLSRASEVASSRLDGERDGGSSDLSRQPPESVRRRLARLIRTATSLQAPAPTRWGRASAHLGAEGRLGAAWSTWVSSHSARSSSSRRAAAS